jgi:hypothetical protein
LRGHHDQVHFFIASYLQDFPGRITIEQQASDLNSVELRPQRLIQLRLGPLGDFRMQVPGEFIPKHPSSSMPTG